MFEKTVEDRDTDGLQGAKAIEKAGGRIMVQEPDSAKFKSMPAEIITKTTRMLSFLRTI